MKYLAIFLVIALLFSIGGVGYLYMTATVVVEATGTVAMEATSQMELFGQLARQAKNGALIGTVYSPLPLEDASQYQFITYTVRLRNDCMIDAESVEIQVYPMEGDVVQIGDFTPKTLHARKTGDISATILASANMHSIREVNITYYMWGLPFTVRATCGN